MRWTTIGREILASAVMSVPVIRRVRVRTGRTIGRAVVDRSRSQWFVFERELDDQTGKRVVEAGTADLIPMVQETLMPMHPPIVATGPGV